jgi:hypothetical protein
VQSLPSEQGRLLLVCAQPVAALQASSVHSLPSSQFGAAPGTQTPLAHTSLTVQALLSVQAPVWATVVQPAVASQPSMVHGLPSLHTTPKPGTHAELAHVSPDVHALPSLQGNVLAVKTQPLAALQVSLVHGLLSLQTLAAPGTHAPFAHVSPTLHTLPSVHAAVVLLKTQPVAPLQASLVHGLLSLHVTVAPLAHAPPAQTSPAVHALPSEHALLLLAWMHPPATPHESVVHRLPSSQSKPEPETQPPFAHVSPKVHALWSEHGAALLLFTQPLVGSHASSVQRLPSLQTSAAPGWQLLFAHASPLVQALLSVQPSAFAVCVHPPLASQASLVQTLLSSQPSALPGTHAPLAQRSFTVQSLLSLQGAVLLVKLQPVAGLHASLVQGLPSLQMVAVPGTHAPPPQRSPLVHALLSVHACALAVCVQPPLELQVSVVHTLLSSQPSALPGMQVPPAHVSLTVQSLLSVQDAVLLLKVQPLAGLHASSVQTLPSLQLTVAPGMHAPPPHVSPWVHALPSLHATLLATCWQPAAALQLSLVHRLPSLQSGAAPGMQSPPAQVSLRVQALLSLHGKVLSAVVQPVAGEHASVVQRLPSLHTSAGPGWQPLFAQTSPLVHALLSVQASVLALCVQPPLTLQASVVQTLPSSQPSPGPGTHAPAAQESLTVHALLSLHGKLLLAILQPLAGKQVSVVQRLPSLQTTSAPGLQVALAHTSPWVHALPSLHACVLAVKTQPVTAPHASFVHGLLSLQTMAAPDTQSPPAHASPLVQALLSVQASALLLNTQPPLASHVSLVQTLPSLQTSAAPGWHAPAPQTSPLVQALLSLHAIALALCVQPPLVPQTSVVHGLPSSQGATVPPVQMPPTHLSFNVHELPSSHALALAVKTQPVVALQASSVHGLPSAQTRLLPGLHAPPAQVSPTVQTLPSEHDAVLLLWTQPFTGSQLSLVQPLLSSQFGAAPGMQLPATQASLTVQALLSLHGPVCGVMVQPLPGLQPSVVHGLPSLHTRAEPG